VSARAAPVFDLFGKLALVIGGSRGIGEATALALAGAGADLAITSRDLDRVSEPADRIRELGRSVSTHVADVRSVDSLAAMVDEVVAQRGGIDICVYNAGTNVQKLALDVTETDWDLVNETNLKGCFFALQAVGRTMIERATRGRIVNIASTFAVGGYPKRVIYAATKHGVVGVTKALAIEWAGYGITVNAIAPTAINTQMNADLFRDDDWRAEVLARIPAGRFAVPDDVAAAAVYLASPAAEMVTGHVLLVDGGWAAI
jgi:NAD(P)-dependent dehydrogenase (short-subunit alcohol dehydrogenase family)